METTKQFASPGNETSLRKLVFLLAQRFFPLRIYEFSSSFNIANSTDIFFGRCLLMVTDNPKRIDYQVQDFINGKYADETVTVICHDKEAIANAVGANSRFFITILTQGRLLYSNGQMLEFEPTLPYDPALAVERAQELFKYRMPLAHGFFSAAMECYRLGHYSIGTFLLHQSCEQTLICMIRVHLGYRSEFHNIHRLLGLCSSFSPRPYHTLVDIDNNARLFSILSSSYSGARYNSGFSVEEADADAISQRVSKLLSLAAEMYFDHIKHLEHITGSIPTN